MKRNINRWVTVGTLSVMSIGGLGFTSGVAHARKSSLYKYGTIAGAAVAGYGLVEGKNRTALAGAAVGAGSYYMYRRSKKQETEERRRQTWYRRHYGKNWRRHYARGR